MRPNLSRPFRNSSTATSFAALNAAGVVPPAFPAARPIAYAGKTLGGTGSKVRLPISTGSNRRVPASATRSGWVKA